MADKTNEPVKAGKARIWAYVSKEDIAKYETVAAKMIYPPSLQDVINRGIVLAIKELAGERTDR